MLWLLQSNCMCVYHVLEFDDSKVSYMSRGRAWNCTLYRGRGELRVCSCSCVCRKEEIFEFEN